MKSWLHRMLAEIDAVTDEQANSVPADIEGCPHEHVVGVLTPELKKLRFVARQYGRREQELQASLAHCPPSEHAAVAAELIRFKIQADRLKQIFWLSCRDAFPELWDKTMIAIRPGEKVIWSEHGEATAALSGLLDMLGGRGRSGHGGISVIDVRLVP